MTGVPFLNSKDIEHTGIILLPLLTNHRSCIEFGSGVGRVTAQLLAENFEEVECVEQDTNLLKQARTNITAGNITFVNKAIQEYSYLRTFDVIYFQWVLEYLSDLEVANFLAASVDNLNKGGLIVVKENVDERRCVVDKEGSIIRERSFYRLTVLKELTVVVDKTEELMKDLFPVQTLVLRKC